MVNAKRSTSGKQSNAEERLTVDEALGVFASAVRLLQEKGITVKGGNIDGNAHLVVSGVTISGDRFIKSNGNFDDNNIRN